MQHQSQGNRLEDPVNKKELQRNKRNVIAFYDTMFNQCKPREAVEQFAGDT